MSKALWDFAVQLYAQPGVETACLRLQDEHDEDVCLLLCAVWLGWRGVICTPARCQQLREVAADWQHEVVAPLRALRRRWKVAASQDAGLAALRQRLAELEQDAERELLRRLEACCAEWPTQASGEPLTWLTRLASPTTCAAELTRLAVAAGR